VTATAIKSCTCEHPFQDKRYGKWMRVHNWGTKKEAWICTVCRSVKKK
jgi:hypothetical protein